MLRSYLRELRERLAPPRLYILGITRFSLVTEKTLSGFELTRGLSFADAKALIYAPERMEARFGLFEAACLPTYRMMKRQYRHSAGLVLIGRSMPKQYVDRLRSLAKGGAIRIIRVADTEKPQDAVNRVIAALRPKDRVYSYRLDDDDALSVDFIKTIRQRAKETPDSTVISFDWGLSLRRLDEGTFGVKDREQPMIAIGLGTFCKPSKPMSPMQMGNHAKIAEKWPVHHVREPSQWLRVAHEFNDSKSRMSATMDGADVYDVAGLVAALRDKFPQISRDGLRRIAQFK